MLFLKGFFLGMPLWFFLYFQSVHSSFFSASKNTLQITLEHRFLEDDFKLYQPYLTPSGDSVLFTRFSYYLSNIELIDDKGKSWKEKESYHYIHIKDNSVIKFLIENVPPVQKIRQIRFGLGIDAKRNSSGAQINALDPLNGMFWTWEQGYVFLKMEGFVHPTSKNRKGLIVHIGSNVNYQTITLPFQIFQEKLTVKVLIDRIFGKKGIDNVVFQPSDTSSTNIMSGEKAHQLAQNAQKMFQMVEK